MRKLLAHSQIAVNIREGVFDLTALAYTARNGALGLMKALLEHPQVDPTDGRGHTPLLVEAAENGHAGVVRTLLSMGQINVNTVLMRPFARTVLMALVEGGRVETGSVAQALLSTAGVDVDFQDKVSRTALMLVASAGVVGIVKLNLFWGRS